MEPNVVDPFAYDPDAAAEREARRDAVQSTPSETPEAGADEFVWCDPATLATRPRDADGPADSSLTDSVPPETGSDSLDPSLVSTRRGGVIDSAISRLAAVRQRVEHTRQDDGD